MPPLKKGTDASKVLALPAAQPCRIRWGCRGRRLRTAKKKWGWTLITPGTTHCPLTNKGGKFILIRVVPTEGRQKYKRPLGSATHEKGGFPTPSRFDAFTPLRRDELMLALPHPCRYP